MPGACWLADCAELPKWYATSKCAHVQTYSCDKHLALTKVLCRCGPLQPHMHWVSTTIGVFCGSEQ